MRIPVLENSGQILAKVGSRFSTSVEIASIALGRIPYEERLLNAVGVLKYLLYLALACFALMVLVVLPPSLRD
jgi:hypothetical protein